MEELEKQLVTDSGFIAEFWRRLAAYRQTDPRITQQAVFDELNDLYEASFGEPKFASYDAFRMRRDRASKKKRPE